MAAKTTTKTNSKRRSLTLTFRRKALETAFQSWMRAHREEFGVENRDERLRHLLRTEVEYITNESFTDGKAVTEILGDCFMGTGVDVESKRQSKMPDLPVYLARMCETKLLKPEEEASLFRRMNFYRHLANQFRSRLNFENSTIEEVIRVEALIALGDWHRDCIVKSNMRLVISIVKKFVNSYNSFDDLLSDGAMALMRAVDKFDYGRGFRFSTYATQVVRRNSYRTVMLKQEERQKVTASIDESSIDVSDEIRQPTMSEQKWHDLRAKLALLLDNLDRREKLIVRARFSLGGHRRVKTLQKLADKLGVSKERVRQLEKRALEKLRGMADDLPLPEASPE
jgi:RNA polymerase primary sigma factor